MEKFALITWWTNWIGKEFAYQLAEQWYNIIIVWRDKERWNKILKDIKAKFNVECELLLADLCNVKWIQKVSGYIQNYKNLEVFINWAWFFEANEFLEDDLEKWNNMLELNSKSLMNLSYCIWNKMKSEWTKWAIINIASIAAFLPVWNPMYAWTKSFARTFSLSLNKEFKKHWIYVQTLCPGCVETNLWTSSFWKSPRLWKLPVEKVVKESLKCVKKWKDQCIPGFMNKLIVLWMQIMPRCLVYRISKWIVRY